MNAAGSPFLKLFHKFYIFMVQFNVMRIGLISSVFTHEAFNADSSQFILCHNVAFRLGLRTHLILVSFHLS